MWFSSLQLKIAVVHFCDDYSKQNLFHISHFLSYPSLVDFIYRKNLILKAANKYRCLKVLKIFFFMSFAFYRCFHPCSTNHITNINLSLSLQIIFFSSVHWCLKIHGFHSILLQFNSQIVCVCVFFAVIFFALNFAEGHMRAEIVYMYTNNLLLDIIQ